MRLDAHQHFWRYDPSEYGWIEPATMGTIARDFVPADLVPHLLSNRIDGCVAVQARCVEAENTFLLELAAAEPRVRAVVGWVDLGDAGVDAALERWSSSPRFRGVREIAQGQAPGFLLRDAFVRGVSRLRDYGLTYDILIYADQVREATAFVDRCPADQPFVVDHVAKPRIAAGEIEAWRADITDLARRPNVCCKLSGMVTEAGGAWTPASIRPYMDAVLAAFGPSRLMYGSDWPVCLLAASYQQVHGLVETYVASLSQGEQAAIMGDVASRFYGVDSSS